jgi:Uma2 family endonuclease
MSAFPLEQEIEYPTSAGQLMAETLEHQQVMIDLILGLRQRYAERTDVWVAGNFVLCYERGNPRAHVAPDVMLAKGVAQRARLNYLLWEERPLSLVVEVTSRTTRREDEGKKKALYERIGVEEYVLFDPFGEYLRPRLQGYRLERGRYRPIPLQEDGSLLSRATGMTFRPEGERLRLVDTATGEPQPWDEELRGQIGALEAAHDRETAARKAAEDRVRTLEAELSRLRKSQSPAKSEKP